LLHISASAAHLLNHIDSGIIEEANEDNGAFFPLHLSSNYKSIALFPQTSRQAKPNKTANARNEYLH